MSDLTPPSATSWGARAWAFVRLESVLVLVLVYAIFLATLAAVFLLFAEGREFAMEEERRLLWAPRNIVEVVFFVSQIGVAILAAVALQIAKHHADHMAQRTQEAVRARKATVYMEINSRYNSSAVTYSRLRLVYLMELHAQGARAETVAEFVDARLREMYDDAFGKFDETLGGECDYTRTLKLLSYLEDIGVLVERQYVDAEDVFDFMGGVITMVEVLLRQHIIWRRQQEGSPALYANALRLMARAASFPHTTFDEGVYRLAPPTP